MNRYVVFIILIIVLALTIGLVIGLRYSQAPVLFGVVAAALAPLATHKVPSTNVVIGLLCGLAYFASFPLKKLFQLDGFVQEATVTLVYFAMLLIIGAGWKRDWTSRR